MTKLRNHYLATFVAMVVLSGNLLIAAGNSASTNAQAKAKIKKAISISKNADLDFGEAYTGDSEKTLDASSNEGAQFSVNGENNKAYSITLPSSVTMSTDDGVGADKQIVVNSFNSNPGASSGQLSASGSQTLYVGGTRAAISSSQYSGDYVGSFQVTVTYQ